jgi:hypothetical protein
MLSINFVRQIVWASQNPGKPCSEMLRGLEVVKTNDIAQALEQTVQVQPFKALLGVQLYQRLRSQLAAIREDTPHLTTPSVAEPCAQPVHSDCRNDDTEDV